MAKIVIDGFYRVRFRDKWTIGYFYKKHDWWKLINCPGVFESSEMQKIDSELIIAEPAKKKNG